MISTLLPVLRFDLWSNFTSSECSEVGQFTGNLIKDPAVVHIISIFYFTLTVPNRLDESLISLNLKHLLWKLYIILSLILGTIFASLPRPLQGSTSRHLHDVYCGLLNSVRHFIHRPLCPVELFTRNGLDSKGG